MGRFEGLASSRSKELWAISILDEKEAMNYDGI
jgi:hypothetical protein